MKRINWKKAEKGQSLVEFSLGIVFLLIIVSGLIDLGRLYFTHVALEDAVGEAALYLSINPHCKYGPDKGGPAECANPNNADYRAHNSGGQEVDWAKATFAFDVPEPYGVGETVKASVSYSYPLLTAIIPKIVGINPITLTSSASQTVITELQ
jgi:hypothetical protein